MTSYIDIHLGNCVNRRHAYEEMKWYFISTFFFQLPVFCICVDDDVYEDNDDDREDDVNKEVDVGVDDKEHDELQSAVDDPKIIWHKLNLASTQFCIFIVHIKWRMKWNLFKKAEHRSSGILIWKYIFLNIDISQLKFNAVCIR